MGKYLKEISKTYIEKDTTEMLSKEELQQFLKKYEEGNYRVAEKIYEGRRSVIFR